MFEASLSYLGGRLGEPHWVIMMKASHTNKLDPAAVSALIILSDYLRASRETSTSASTVLGDRATLYKTNRRIPQNNREPFRPPARRSLTRAKELIMRPLRVYLSFQVGEPPSRTVDRETQIVMVAQRQPERRSSAAPVRDPGREDLLAFLLRDRGKLLSTRT